MKMHGLLFGLLSPIVLFGCSSVGPGLANHPLDCAMGIPWGDCLPGTPGYNRGGGSATRLPAFQEAQAQADRVCEQALSDQRLDPLRDKIAFSHPEAPTFAMRTNTQYLASGDKTIFELLMQARSQCTAALHDVRKLKPPQSAAVETAAEQTAESLFAQFYLGQITYSELADKRAKNASDVQLVEANIAQALGAQNQQSQFQAQALANQAVANFNAQMQTQAVQQMNSQTSMPRPAKAITCNTAPLGSGTTTTCR